MLSPSSFFSKIIGVLASNGGEKWNQYHSCVGSMLLLNMALVCIRVRLGTTHLVIWLPSWVWVISFDCSYVLCHVTMTLDPLMSNTAKSSAVLLICSREVGLCNFQPPSDSLLILIHKHYGPPLIKVTSYRLQPIIQEVDLETPFRYLGACMPQW